MTGSRMTRAAAAIVAAAAWIAELLFLLSHLRATGSLPYASWLLVAYLTDWTNLLVALVCTAVAFDAPRCTSPLWRVTATAAIVLVGIMFAIMGGWSVVLRQGVGSTLAHVVTPILMLLLWTAMLPHGGLGWRDAPRVMAFPILYLAAMFARGLLGGGYPYPDVDVSRVGWAGALTFAGAVALLFLAIGSLLIWVDRVMAVRRLRETA